MCSLLSSGIFAQSTLHDFAVVTILGDTISLSQFYGKKVMVVNTATLCAYTHQYTDLEVLYTNYNQYNFEIVGFPCNNFGSQEPGSDSTINEFCHNNYDVTFPMMSKVDIVSGDTADVYKWLQRGDLNGVQTAHVSWNFNKFLIDEAGHWVRHFDSPVSPTDTAITNWIMTPSVIQTGVVENNKTAIQVYPNPTVNGVVTLQGTANVSGIQVVNIMGQQVYSAQVNADKIQLDLSSQPKGVYLYRLIAKKGIVQIGKLIVE
jgi:glutathione peroxidase